MKKITAIYGTTYKDLEKENKKLKIKIDKLIQYINKHPINPCHYLLNILNEEEHEE